MAREIERKFLVTGDGWKAHATSSHRIKDGIAPFGDGKVRVRIAERRAWIAFKGPRDGISRAEFEYPIPVEEALEILRTFRPGSVKVKTRHCVPLDGHVWSVDVHEEPNPGLITADLELDHEAESFDRPAWLGREISGAAPSRDSLLFFPAS